MVYRLYRANRFLMARIFVVLLIYAIIIGAIGFVLLGVVVSFDTQSFNSIVFDANVPGAGDNLETGKICDNYKSEDCPWLLFNDLQQKPNYKEFEPSLNGIQNRLFSQNLILLKEKQTNNTELLKAVARFSNDVWENSTFFTSHSGLVTENESCLTLLKGESCSYLNIDTKTNPPPELQLQLVPNLNLYNGQNGSFLGSKVLVDTSPQHNIICKSFPENCLFYQNSTYSYVYFGQTNGSYQKDKAISAELVIIAPNNLVSQTGQLQDADTTGSVHVICQNEDNGTTDYCNDKSISEDRINFIFIDELNNIRIGTIELDSVLSPNSNNNVLDLTKSFDTLACTKTSQTGLLYISNTEPINCGPSSADQQSSFVAYNVVESPLEAKSNVNDPKLVFNIQNQNISAKIVLLKSTPQGKSSLAILLNIFSKPGNLIRSIFTNGVSQDILIVSVVAFFVNLILALGLIFLRLWKRIGGWLGPKSTLMLRGRLGGLLELTQFFEFGGSWYLEAQSVNDYNFKSTMGVVHELVVERWRDTIFFPTSLAASIAIIVFSIYADPNSLMSLFVLGGVLPLLLAFWIPALWVIEDSGLKRAEWNSSGELLTIQKISAILRDGFNKLVGFGAIFGVGTAGASVARANLQGASVSSSTAITGGFENLINLNFNFLISAVLWTAALLCIVTAVSLSGNVITSLSYLNSDHLSNVKKMRTKLQQKDVFLGTTQPSMDHGDLDTSVYFDSKQGIDSVLSQQQQQQQASKRGKALPSNSVITKQSFTSEEDLTQIIIADPKEFEDEPQDEYEPQNEDEKSVEDKKLKLQTSETSNTASPDTQESNSSDSDQESSKSEERTSEEDNSDTKSDESSN